MKNFLVLIETTSDIIHSLRIKADNFSDAEKQILLFPNLKEIIQISIYN